MSTEIRFLPYQSQNPAAPTMSEIQSATLILDGAFIDVTAAFKQAQEEPTHRLYGNYETSFSLTVEYPVTRREHRQVITRLARACRRPATIHNGRKPR